MTQTFYLEEINKLIEEQKELEEKKKTLEEEQKKIEQNIKNIDTKICCKILRIGNYKKLIIFDKINEKLENLI